MSEDDKTIQNWNQLVDICAKLNEQQAVKSKGVAGVRAAAIRTAIGTNAKLHAAFLQAWTRKHARAL